MIYENILKTIGNTPLVRINKIPCSKAELLVKIEGFNPGGSSKDRASLYMIKNAVERGLLKDGGTIVEPTSGNTGIGLAMACTVLGYNLVIVMPENMSIERQRLMKAYGAKVVLTPKSEGMKGAISIAKEMSSLGYIMLNQFENLGNVEAHYRTTAKEILENTDYKVSAFVAGIGTGGTISGVGKALKEYNPSIKIIGVEPYSSPLLTKGIASVHKIQGIGANFVPPLLNMDVIDEIIPVKDEDAFKYVRDLGRLEGILCGISSGAALCAAVKVSNKFNSGDRIVVLLPDTGERYLSTDLYEGE